MEGSGAWMESWPKYVMLFLIVAVVIGIIAVRNRSRR